MFTVILKIILCSSIFIAVYYLFLEKEKMYRFNRFYLLCSLVLSYIIPFITITVQAPEVETKPQLVIEEAAQQIMLIQPDQESFNWMNVIWVFYASATIFLLIKSTLAIFKIKRIKGEKCIYQSYNIVLTKEDLSPFSFWNTIYMGKNYIQKDNTIDPGIFLHEKSHLDQKHSIDLIIADLFKIFTWFNPVIFLYKKAIIGNHEFLADESVLSKKISIKEYQNLILNEILSHQNPSLTHSFNFNNTKKRFIMMKAKKSKFSFLKKTTGVAVLITAAALFSERTYAGNLTNESVSQSIPQNLTSTKDSEELKDTPDENVQISNDEEVNKGRSTAIVKFKKEHVKTASDTIIPKNTQKTETNEGKNTNTTMNIQSNIEYTQAEYPDGLKSLREQIGKHMDVGTFGDFKGATIKSMAYIHIDETGKTTHVTTSGDNEAFNKEFLKTVTAISNETTWKPAMKDGKAIASVLKVPATMTFTRP